MFIPLVLLLVVAHARPIGPIPSIPVLHQVNQDFDAPLVTELPNLSSPDDFDPSFTPSFPDPSLPLQPPFSAMPSVTPPQMTPSLSPPQFSAPLVTPSSAPFSPASSTTPPPTLSSTPSTPISSTPTSASPSSSPPVSSTPSTSPPSPSTPSSSPPTPSTTPSTTQSTTPSTTQTSQPQPTSPLEPDPNKGKNSSNLKAEKDAPATTTPLSTFLAKETITADMSVSSVPSTTASTKTASPETPRVSNETDSQPNPPTDPATMGPMPSRSPLPPATSAQRTPCFPAAAGVTLVDGSLVPIHRLEIGDVVHVGSGRYSSVHMFTHRVYHTMHEFVKLTTDSGRVLTLSEGHYVYVGNVLKPAREVLLGDCLPLGEGGFTCVNKVETVMERGLYNPQTGTGDIVVNGIKASVYTEAVKPALAHAALLPLRLAFSLFGVSTQCVEHGYPDFVPVNLRSLLAV